MLHIILHALHDSMHLVPFLFLTYLVMGILEYAAGDRSKKIIESAGKFGPVWGGILGAFPQCGFSAGASYFYIERVITLGTLISIYLSTSDEMLPILISEQVPVKTIISIIVAKIIIGMISGFVIEIFFERLEKKRTLAFDVDLDLNFEHHREHHREGTCDCGHSHEHDHFHGKGAVVVNAVYHTLKVFVFIFLVSVVVGGIMHHTGEEKFSMLFSGMPVVGEAVAALVGLIPNCAASVVITRLYLDGIIGTGAMMSGLLSSAGVGLLVLLKENKNIKESLWVIAILYVVSVAWGVLIGAFGIVF